MKIRPIEQQLYKSLINSNGDFLGFNPIESKDMYAAVKNQFPNLCDDDFICPHYSKQHTNQPEWQHVVRKFRERMKQKGLAMRTRNYAEWVFLPRVKNVKDDSQKSGI